MLIQIAVAEFERMNTKGATEPVPKSPYMSRTDWRALARLCKTVNPKRVLEIGTAWGDTTLWLAKNCLEAYILTIGLTREMGIPCTQGSGDETKSEVEAGRAFKGTPEEARISKAFADSMTLNKDSDLLTPKPFDMILIDGNHDYEHVKNDSILAQKLLNLENGVIVWHDCISEKGVNKYLSECGLYVFHVEHTQIAYMHNRKPEQA